MFTARCWLRAAALGAFTLLAPPPARATALPAFDFTQAADCAAWTPDHDIARAAPTAGGLRVEITGNDPYLHGPARDFPANTPLWLLLKLNSEQGGMAQVFYFRDQATEEKSVRFDVPAGRWFEAKVRLPALGPGWHLRIDPPGDHGTCVLAALSFAERVQPAAPAWPKPDVPELGADAVTLESGDLKLIHGRHGVGDFEIQVAGRLMACGNRHAMIGYLAGEHARWIPFGNGAGSRVRVDYQPLTRVADAMLGGTIRVHASTTDPDGAQWEIEQVFALSSAGTLAVSTRVSADHDRDVLYLPMFTLLPGLGSYGTNKTQALFPGVEYLENEPSSSTADLNPPASNRQVPDTLKITFPLMAVAAEDRYVGFIWNRDQNTNLCAVFDSPDRFFHSGAHLMGLLFPGSNGLNRDESSLLPYAPVTVPADHRVEANVLILGGRGKTVIPAVQQYVRLNGLPALPDPGLAEENYFALAAHGWLDSKIRDGDHYRHAFWPGGFKPAPSADAAWTMDWLADKVNDTNLVSRLHEAAAAALAAVPPAGLNFAQLGHVHYPLPALVFGHVAENVAAAREHARGLLDGFEPDSSVLYRQSTSGSEIDYARTHWSHEANGLTAQRVATLLDDAVLVGDRELINTALHHLRALDKFRDTVPRGAQTWEIPLHTPDILASAHLVRAYTLGYELTGDPNFLNSARYWAWTGVPFVYLSAPTPQPVGLYATIPVLGATSWVAPIWIGLPVQWCGLVYADALHRFSRYDPDGPWKQIADGIAVSGVQQSWPTSDRERQGLLPDSFQLRAQQRNGPAINPATTLLPAAQMFGEPRLYDFRVFRQSGLMVHAPGPISAIKESAGTVTFTIAGWPTKPYWILVNGFAHAPTVKLNGKPLKLESPQQFQSDAGRLILQLEGKTTVEIRLDARE
jgi:hypothetical protein